MPALSLDVILMALLPWLSAQGRAALRATVAAGGALAPAPPPRARAPAHRFHLTRLRKREGLPALGVLSVWISIRARPLEAGAGGAALPHNRKSPRLTSSHPS